MGSLNTHMRKKILFLIKSSPKINFRKSVNLNVKNKARTFLQDNLGKYLYNFELRKDFFKCPWDDGRGWVMHLQTKKSQGLLANIRS